MGIITWLEFITCKHLWYRKQQQFYTLKRSIKLCKRLLLLAHNFEAKANVKILYINNTTTHLLFKEKEKETSYSYRKMDLKKLFLCGLLIIVSVLSQTCGMPNFSHLRLRRSPQGPLSPWCNSPFLNYPFFTSRFCPPNPNCKLTVGREDRDCAKLE